MAKQVHPLIGLVIENVEELGNGFLKLTFDNDMETTILCSDLLESEVEDSDEEEEEEEEAPKKGKGKASKKVEEEDEEDDDDDEDDEEDDEEDEQEDLTAEDLIAADFDDLEDMVDDYELDVDVDDFEDDEDGLRKAIAKELDITLPKSKGKGKKGK